MAGFDDSLISKIQESNDIVEVVAEHVSLVRKGTEMVGLCPFHQDHSPSMYVSPVKQIFKCFACGAGGDAFKFLQMRENLSFPQAVERLAQRAGIEIQVSHQPQQQNTDQLDPNVLSRVNKWAMGYFQSNLLDEQKGESARKYLSERQIDKNSIETWRLGLAVGSYDDLITAAREKGLKDLGVLEKAGLVVSRDGKYQDKFVNRLMFPITDVTGRVIGFGGRTLTDAPAKYINSPTTVLFDKSNCLYGLEQSRHAITQSGTAVVVEGYTDCIIPHQAGCKNVIATLGTSFTAGHARMLRRFAKRIVLIFDNDTAGAEAANRALEVCLAQRIDIKIAAVDEGKDPCDFVLAAGREGFERLIAEAVDVFEFKWQRLKGKFADDDTISGRKQAVDEFLQALAVGLGSGNLDAVEKGIIVNRLADIVGMEPRDINQELKKRLGRGAGKLVQADENRSVKSVDMGNGLFAAAQREVIEVALNEPSLLRGVKAEIGIENFDVPMFRKLASVLFGICEQDGQYSISKVLSRIESVEAASAVVKLADQGSEKGNYQQRLKDAIKVMRRYTDKKIDKKIEDHANFLRQVRENTAGENRHNLGMI